MRNASLRPLAACENTTNAGDGKCADPYSEPSMAIEFDVCGGGRNQRFDRTDSFVHEKKLSTSIVSMDDGVDHFRLQYTVVILVYRKNFFEFFSPNETGKYK